MKNFVITSALAIATALANLSGVAAQTPTENDMLYGELAGRVLDAENHQPLNLVNVYLDSTRFGAASANDGSFLITRVPPGKYRLVLSRLGYEKLALAGLVLPPGKLFSRDFLLRATDIVAEEITITATRKEQTAQMAPASVAIVSAGEMRQRDIVTFDQALEVVPGVSVMRSAGISVQAFSIRGSSDVAGGGVGNRVLLLIDGRPALTSDSGGALWSLVPTNFIDRIEVVKGAFSSLYGSTAMGGVVNVITRRPSYDSRTRIEANFGIYQLPPPAIRYSDTAGRLSSLAINHSGRSQNVSYLVSLSRKQSTGHRERSAYEFYDLYAKLMFDFRRNRNLEISIGGTDAKNDYPHTWRSPLNPLRVAPHQLDNRQEKRAFNADLFYWALPNTRIKYSSRFYFYRNAARSFFNEHDVFLQIRDNEPLGFRTSVDADKFGNITQLDWAITPSNYLILGVDGQIDRVQSAPDTIMYGNRQVNNLAVYAQHEITAISRFTVTAGSRLDDNILVGGKRQTQLSPKLSAVYQLRDNLALRAQAGQAFRAPSIAERFFRREISGDTRFVPNPQLKAERKSSLELGMRLQLGEWLDADVAVFHDRYRDMIYWIALPQEIGQFEPLFQVRNLNRAMIQGAEFEINLYRRPYLRLHAAYTYLDAQDRSAGRIDNRLAYRIRHALNFGGNFTWKTMELNVDGRYTGRVEEVFLYQNDEPKAYLLLNSKFAAHIFSSMTLSLSCNNLLDAQYEELARYRMPGRHYIGGIGLEF
jgi:outer membrane receptor for ferrienterochelin and colicin